MIFEATYNFVDPVDYSPFIPKFKHKKIGGSVSCKRYDPIGYMSRFDKAFLELFEDSSLQNTLEV